jgi:hypothetical protein
MQSVIEQKFNSLQYIYMLRLSYKWISGRTQLGLFMQVEGDYLNRVHSDQMVLKIDRRKAEPVSCGQK